MSRTADRVRKLFRGLAGNRGKAEAERSPQDELIKTSMSVGTASYRGPREHNEDYVAVSWRGDFVAVSDGIGGAPFGDVMSRLGCNAAVSAFDDGAHAREAFDIANEVASFTSELLDERSGATLLVAERRGNVLHVVAAGDTRAYCLRDNRLEALTGTGRMSQTSNALSKAIGYGAIEPDEVSFSLLSGDRLLLCTDGVWEYLSMERIANVLGSKRSAPLIADAIAREGAQRGQDNSTCACLFVECLGSDVADTPRMPGTYGPRDIDTPRVDLL